MAMVDAAKRTGRYGKRDALMILMCFRHAFRAVELCTLKWSQIDWIQGRWHVARVKNGDDSVQYLEADELRGLRDLQRSSRSPFAFSSERSASLATRAFGMIVERAGREAGLPLTVHTHMLRHSAGYALANAGQDTGQFKDSWVTRTPITRSCTLRSFRIGSRTSGAFYEVNSSNSLVRPASSRP
jgi:type 1 fimbriae regulatory protein FimE